MAQVSDLDASVDDLVALDLGRVDDHDAFPLFRLMPTRVVDVVEDSHAEHLVITEHGLGVQWDHSIRREPFLVARD